VVVMSSYCRLEGAVVLAAGLAADPFKNCGAARWGGGRGRIPVLVSKSD
jgi:hypothetical protein